MTTLIKQQNIGALTFRVALFIVAASLAAYIPYKYATSLHAVQGMYAYLFPLSGLLALVGMILAVNPKACDCSAGIRSGVAGLSILWMGIGLMCVPSLTSMIIHSPLGGLFASFHLLSQHVFLSLSLLGFALAPAWMLSKLGIIQWTATATTTETVPTEASPSH